MQALTQISAWAKLQSYLAEMLTLHMNDLFRQEPKRKEWFQWQLDELFVDASHNLWDQNIFNLLLELAEELKLKEQMEVLFRKKVAYYPFLRDGQQIQDTVYFRDFKNLVSLIQAKKYRTIIHVGMGGSHLGMEMAIEALKPFQQNETQFLFINNIDAVLLDKVLEKINLDQTLMIIASKTLDTPEIHHFVHLLYDHIPRTFFSNQTVVVTAYPEKIDLPVPHEHMLLIPEEVSGRFSIWSGMGLSLAVAIGLEAFLAFLQGASELDQHFLHAPLQENIPIILGLLSIWYICFLQTQQHIIIPYEHSLKLLPHYLQQLHMESCGKSIQKDGVNATYLTGSSVWGALGLPGQHAFYQWLHQGTHLAPIDFIMSLNPQAQSEFAENCHDILLANCLSQSQILAFGKQVIDHPHEFLPGNRPHNLIFLKQINPKSLGALLALYEHKVFVQSLIWNINAFDQWGVEYGKQVSKDNLSALKKVREEQPNQILDFSVLKQLLKNN